MGKRYKIRDRGREYVVALPKSIFHRQEKVIVIMLVDPVKMYAEIKEILKPVLEELFSAPKVKNFLHLEKRRKR